MQFSEKFRLFDSQIVQDLNFKNEFKSANDKRNLLALIEMKLDTIDNKNDGLYTLRKLKTIIQSQQKIQESKSQSLDQNFTYLEQLRDGVFFFINLSWLS